MIEKDEPLNRLLVYRGYSQGHRLSLFLLNKCSWQVRVVKMTLIVSFVDASVYEFSVLFGVHLVSPVGFDVLNVGKSGFLLGYFSQVRTFVLSTVG
jgi:hypothetical protein